MTVDLTLETVAGQGSDSVSGIEDKASRGLARLI